MSLPIELRKIYELAAEGKLSFSNDVKNTLTKLIQSNDWPGNQLTQATNMIVERLTGEERHQAARHVFETMFRRLPTDQQNNKSMLLNLAIQGMRDTLKNVPAENRGKLAIEACRLVNEKFPEEGDRFLQAAFDSLDSTHGDDHYNNIQIIARWADDSALKKLAMTKWLDLIDSFPTLSRYEEARKLHEVAERHPELRAKAYEKMQASENNTPIQAFIEDMRKLGTVPSGP